MIASIFVALTCLVSDFFPAYSSIKTYRQASSDIDLKYWQKYWSVRSLFLLIDFLVWPYLEEYEFFYLLKVAGYLSLSYFGVAVVIYDTVLTQVYNEVEPYAELLIQHTALSGHFSSWKGILYKFFIEDLEEFLVPN